MFFLKGLEAEGGGKMFLRSFGNLWKIPQLVYMHKRSYPRLGCQQYPAVFTFISLERINFKLNMCCPPIIKIEMRHFLNWIPLFFPFPLSLPILLHPKLQDKSVWEMSPLRKDLFFSSLHDQFNSEKICLRWARL